MGWKRDAARARFGQRCMECSGRRPAGATCLRLPRGWQGVDARPACAESEGFRLRHRAVGRDRGAAVTHIRRHVTALRYMAALLVLAVVTLSRRAGGQEAKPVELDSATVAAIAPIIQQARAANLPLELLYAKAREGQVQRAPVARIEAAVRALAARVQAANDALAPNATAQELGAAADALKAGVPRE